MYFIKKKCATMYEVASIDRVFLLLSLCRCYNSTSVGEVHGLHQ